LKEKKYSQKRKKNIFSLNNFLETKFLTPNEAKKHDIKIAMDGVKRSCLEVMGQRKVNMAKIRQIFSDIPVFSDLIEKQVVVDAHYMGYLKRQERDIKSFKKDESVIIPKNINYENLSGLSNEVKSKLISIRPKTLGQAIRIDGVTPAAVIILLSHIKKLKFKATA
jgi:tRNA uridine 5-carboxymethylaminomethyl modification enzyme